MTHPLISKIIKKYSDYYHNFWHLKQEYPEETHIKEKYLYRPAMDLYNDLNSLYKALLEVNKTLQEQKELEALYGYGSYNEEDFDDETSFTSSVTDEEQKVYDDMGLVSTLMSYLDNSPSKNPPDKKPSEISFNTNFNIDLSKHILETVHLNLEGYPVNIYGVHLLSVQEEISFIKTIFKEFASRAQKHFPDLLKHKTPISFFFSYSGLDSDGLYARKSNIVSIQVKDTRNKTPFVYILAHELAHHYYYHVLDQRHRDFWETMIQQDYTSKPIIDFIYDMTDSEDFYDFLMRLKTTDPLRYLQLNSLQNIDDIEKYKKSQLLDANTRGFSTQKFRFNKNPVSVYGFTNPSEAFAEVIGYILGFGTNSILPQLFERMRVIIPNIKLAKENPMQNRIASLERRLASLEHVLSVKTAGSHVKLPSHELAELAHISDKALDHAYHYGMSKPGTFGYKANEQSVLHAMDVIASGNTNIEAIADAVHKGWSHAFFTVKDPAYKDPTIVDEATGLTKGQKKYNSRLALAKTSYHSLSNDEKEKDRVVARAVLAWAEENGWVGGLLP